MRHPILEAKIGDRLSIGGEAHEITDIVSLQSQDTVPIPRVLIWTGYGEERHFLMATLFAQDNQEFLGYTPVGKVTATAKGFRCRRTDYFPEPGKGRLWTSSDKTMTVGVYDCRSEAGASLLVIKYAGRFLGFNNRTRYNPAVVQ